MAWGRRYTPPETVKLAALGEAFKRFRKAWDGNPSTRILVHCRAVEQAPGA